MKLLLLVGICSCLSGCALTLEMMAISGISYLATGKSLSDNAFSMVTNRDCALHRVVMNQAICSENKPSPSENNDGSLIASAKMVDTIVTKVTKVTKVTTPQNVIVSPADMSPDVVTSFSTASISDFSRNIEETPTLSSEYSFAQTFAVVGSFNNYQYAQRRNEKYVHFNPQIIKNQADLATRYRVVVGPIKRDGFIAELPIMVGAETQLPWEIELCVNDMSPPPCHNTYAVNTLQQQSATWVEAPVASETHTLR